MAGFSEFWYNQGEAKGEARGKALGEARGENRLGLLISKLIDIGRDKDVYQVSTDPIYRQKLMAEFGI